MISVTVASFGPVSTGITRTHGPSVGLQMDLPGAPLVALIASRAGPAPGRLRAGAGLRSAGSGYVARGFR